VILLDTHVWVWTAAGDTKRVGRRTRGLITREERQGTVRVSPISIFELTALHTMGRLRLAAPVASWIREVLDLSGLRITPLSPEVAVDAGAIPRDALADPIDRLLVATARQAQATLITADERILEYAAETSSVRVHDARR
jgi:PIN domain nuclease of toxin-antitoxin system